MSGPTRALEAFCATSLDRHLEAHAAIDPLQQAMELFRRAAARVPAYRSRLREAGIDPAVVDRFRRHRWVRTHMIP